MTETRASQFSIRFFQPEDRMRVREICAETGFLGKPIDPLFEDRELFADYLTRYYTDWEPESTLVCVVDGQVSGYIMGCRHERRQRFFNLWHNVSLGLRGAFRYFWRPYNAASRQFIHWLLTQAWREVPVTPEGAAHFHINLLPAARNVPHTHALIQQFIDYLVDCGEKKVFGQMVVYETRRGERMFQRYGFEVIDRKEVTKYRHLHEGRVFLFTVIKDLTKNTQLYGADLHVTSSEKAAS